MCGVEDEDEVRWRRLGGRLWTGHRGARCIGTIEQGRRYVYVDAEGVPHPGRSTLREAQDAATGAIDLVRPVAPPRPRPRRAALGTALLDTALLGGAGVLAAALVWVVGASLSLR